MAHPVHGTDEHREDYASIATQVVDPDAAPLPPQSIPASDAAAGRSVLRKQTLALLALVLTYLQYNFIDVHAQILSLPSNFPLLIP